jgi:hypothetical protein
MLSISADDSSIVSICLWISSDRHVDFQVGSAPGRRHPGSVPIAFVALRDGAPRTF